MITPRLRWLPVLDETAERDLREAVESRLSARIETARRRREARDRFAAEKQARRDAGLRARHDRKLNRISKEN